jgi:hypothetical protein
MEFYLPLNPMEKISCALENYLSIGSNGKIISKSIDI